jgi:hypothetical protein
MAQIKKAATRDILGGSWGSWMSKLDSQEVTQNIIELRKQCLSSQSSDEQWIEERERMNLDLDLTYVVMRDGTVALRKSFRSSV